MLKICWLAATFFAAAAFALDPQKDITQFVHTSWTDQDGAPTEVHALAQTGDGYLWVGTASGVFRFDGVRFTRFKVAVGQDFPHIPIRSLHAGPDGSLWVISTAGHVSRWREGHLTSWSQHEGMNHALTVAESGDGTVIAGTSRGLLSLEGGLWKDIGEKWHFPGKEARQLLYDKTGGLWVTSEDGVRYLPTGQTRFITIDRTGGLGSSSMAVAPNGVLWLADVNRSARAVFSSGSLYSKTPTEVRVGATWVLFDRDGGLWIGSAGDGLRRVPQPQTIAGRSIEQFSPEAQPFTKKDGLSAEYVYVGLQDREGNIWCGTARGIDRFRDAKFTPVSIPHPDQPRFIAASRDGSLWSSAFNKFEILRIGPDGNQHILLAGVTFATAMFEDEAGALWVGTPTKGVAQLIGDRLQPLKMPEGPMLKLVTSMTREKDGSWWFFDGTLGLFHLAGGRLVSLASRDAAKSGFVYRDRHGRIWIARSNGVALAEEGRLRNLSPNDSPPGRVFTFQEDHAGNLWAAGEYGLSKFDRGHFLRVSGGLPTENVYGLVEDDDQYWWLTSDSGVLRTKVGELEHAAADKTYRVRYESFDMLDGMPGLPRKSLTRPVVARTADNRIWFANSNGLSFIDPRRMRKNEVVPPVVIEEIRVKGAQLPVTEGLALDPVMNDLEIDYTALSLSIRERVRFRYKLEGAESDWHDAGTRRQAFYNHLPPNRYRFRVAACNNDGVWNEAGASWDFRILPAFYQTGWFYSLCVAAGVLFLAGAYRLRIGQIAAYNNSRFHERLDERTRLAREFHDTMLQTIQGSKLVADDALEKCTDARTRETLGRLSVWLERAAEEGRSALNSLRTSPAESDNLAEELRSAGEECVFGSPIRFDLSAEGEIRQLHPIIHDEVFRIGYEAIRNSVGHSNARRLSVELSFTNSLILRVRDNGNGFDPDEAARRTDRHFGLLGMRERASRIGGQLKLRSSPGRGTLVEVVVPRNIAFRNPGAQQKPLERIRRFLRR